MPAALIIAWMWNSLAITAKPMLYGEAPFQYRDPRTGNTIIQRKSRKERKKARAYSLQNMDRKLRGLPPLPYVDESNAELIRDTGK